MILVKNNSNIKPSKCIDQLVARSLYNTKNDSKDNEISRDIKKQKAVFRDTHDTMFETSHIQEVNNERKAYSETETEHQYIR